MPKYRYRGEQEALMPTLNRIVQPGEVIEAENLVNGDFEEVPPSRKSPDPAPTTDQQGGAN